MFRSRNETRRKHSYHAHDHCTVAANAKTNYFKALHCGQVRVCVQPQFALHLFFGFISEKFIIIICIYFCANGKFKLRLKICSDCNCSVINTLNAQNAISITVYRDHSSSLVVCKMNWALAKRKRAALTLRAINLLKQQKRGAWMHRLSLRANIPNSKIARSPRKLLTLNHWWKKREITTTKNWNRR